MDGVAFGSMTGSGELKASGRLIGKTVAGVLAVASVHEDVVSPFLKPSLFSKSDPAKWSNPPLGEGQNMLT
jgi:hypothetical protein